VDVEHAWGQPTAGGGAVAEIARGFADAEGGDARARCVGYRVEQFFVWGRAAHRIAFADDIGCGWKFADADGDGERADRGDDLVWKYGTWWNGVRHHVVCNSAERFADDWNAAVTVKNPSNATSNGLKFVVTGGQPTITSIAPSSTPVQANPVNNIPVTLTGTNFTTGSKVFWNGAAAGISATVSNSTSIAATLPGGLLGPYGSTNDVAVLSAPPGGGQSKAVTFRVAAAAPINDNFANAINVTTFTFVDDKDSSGATTEAGDPTPPCVNQYTVAQGNTGGHANGAYNTIWYKYTPTFSANYRWTRL